MLSIVFLFITLSALGLFYFGTGKDKVFLLVSLLWLAVVGGVSYTGYFEDTSGKPPRFLFILLLSIAYTYFSYHKLKSGPLKDYLIMAVHSLRLPVELVLFELFLEKQVPALMTFRGWNFDILMGISGLIFFFYLMSKRKLPRTILIGWNICGLFLLTTIVVIAILSSPLPVQQWAFDQPNTALVKFPFVFLPALIVPIVYLSHFLMLKKLFSSD